MANNEVATLGYGLNLVVELVGDPTQENLIPEAYDNLSDAVTKLDANKADKTQVATDIATAKSGAISEAATAAAATYRRLDTKITADDLSDEVFVFNCGSSTTVI